MIYILTFFGKYNFLSLFTWSSIKTHFPLYCRVINFAKTIVQIICGCVHIIPGVVVCTCNPAILEAEFRDGAGSIPVEGNRPAIGGSIV